MVSYYVDATLGDDGNAGTIGAPWKTIAKVNASSFSAGDSVLFKMGETWTATLIPHDAGTALGGQITYGAYGTGAKPIIDGTGANYCIMDSTGKGYITIDGLHVKEATLYGIAHTRWVSGAEGSTPNWVVQNCEFTHCCIHLYGPNTIVQDNVMVGPTVTAGESYNGAIIISGTVASNCSALRNTISNYAYRGIWFLNETPNPTANYNIIHDITLGGAGIDFDGFGYVITGAVNCIGNIIYNCAKYGMQLENCSDGSLVRDNLIHDCIDSGMTSINYPECARYAEQRGRHSNQTFAYNIVYHCNRGLVVWDVSTINIWNNVLYDFTGTTPYGLSLTASALGTLYTEHIDCRNNIIGGGNDSVFLIKARELIFSVFDYNQVKSALFFEYDTSSHVSLATVQGESAALHCFTNSPAFVDAANHNFHLTADSPCINTGIDVGLTTDFDGNPIT